ncbi:hypothetical protein OWM54_13620 [Myxococcus sp. MISCRS1]|jgi:hypothetical protein|uniref:Uncharacterized protein n=1 Tax=Myxococcus fulvus TaxID=33 RepID=A0A511SUJ7_MYXFU|nr:MULTISPECIES: hypothetical protein [Myxococcus]AKF79930.1 hypothetical protein MFUL124B02_07250 [Myxococcus fulvus 124B02]BDT31762.1 hypothetical protein MFMH1_14310 [Myxococcus sp. MH1]MBZ4400211.1 hypothetical protein [Myxococcus sp. AS-1-15]MBZ4407911.1 hypothetical protein [Myxococcus sp. XM-1-1-1]MCK8497569.1 hypothetical protein [Myxococcus fulvus]
MLSIQEHSTTEEASSDLLDFILQPSNWLSAARRETDPAVWPGQNTLYQRRVGPLRISACVEVSAGLEVLLHIAFRAPGLTPVKAADQLESFLKERLPLTPNSEWQVEVDERRWIHFSRRYAASHLTA